MTEQEQWPSHHKIKQKTIVPPLAATYQMIKCRIYNTEQKHKYGHTYITIILYISSQRRIHISVYIGEMCEFHKHACFWDFYPQGLEISIGANQRMTAYPIIFRVMILQKNIKSRYLCARIM